METPSREQILGEIQRFMKELFELEADRVTPEARLIEDLELDSLDAIDLAVKVEEQIGTSFDEQKIRSLRTIDDVVTALQELIANKNNPPPATPAEPAATES
jgi:acyl carrier protein